jgi:hypothetical protein
LGRKSHRREEFSDDGALVFISGGLLVINGDEGISDEERKKSVILGACSASTISF